MRLEGVLLEVPRLILPYLVVDGLGLGCGHNLDLRGGLLMPCFPWLV